MYRHKHDSRPYSELQRKKKIRTSPQEITNSQTNTEPGIPYFSSALAEEQVLHNTATHEYSKIMSHTLRNLASNINHKICYEKIYLALFFFICLLVPKLLGHVYKYSLQPPRLEIYFLFKWVEMRPPASHPYSSSTFWVSYSKNFICATFAISYLSVQLRTRTVHLSAKIPNNVF